MVTHQLQFLSQCKKILVIKDSAQAAFGDYESITNTGFDIQEILKSYNQQLKDTKKDDQKFDQEMKTPIRKKTTNSSAKKKEEDSSPSKNKEGAGDLISEE